MSWEPPDLGIDTGGTFTDFVTRDGGVAKIPSSALEPGAVIAAGIARLCADRPPRGDRLQIVHGTTVATNALLTGDLAPTGVLVTAGFRDVLALARQTRPRLYDLAPTPAWTAPERAFTAEIHERLDASGRVLTPLDPEEVRRVGARLVRRGARALVVCFLHSYKNPRHERAAARALAALGVPVTTSAALVPEFREYERFSTALANAALRPLLEAYLADLERDLPGAARAVGQRRRPRLMIMQSDGGTIGTAQAAAEPVRLVLSGPAGGIVGAWATASSRERRRLVTLDMGGTSTDVALLDGGEPIVSRCQVAGRPLVVPVLDIHTVGAGGGSIARVDRGGALRVGPESAGARPGPACYGHGGPVTVTDAHVWLDRIPEGHFLGGEFELRRDRAAAAIAALARELDLTPDETALGILRIAEVTMERALRTISLERGHDPRLFSLVAFGGAGGLHAAGLARALRMRDVVLPPDPGLLSARGMLHARVRRERSRTVLETDLERLVAGLEGLFAPLVDAGLRAMAADGVPAADVAVTRWADLRYRGQSYELTVPLADAAAQVRDVFAAAHRARYGFALDDGVVETVALRARFTGPTPAPPTSRRRRTKGWPEPLAVVDAGFASCARRLPTPVYERAALPRGETRAGPALVVEYSATTVVPPGFTCRVDARGCLVLEEVS